MASQIQRHISLQSSLLVLGVAVVLTVLWLLAAHVAVSRAASKRMYEGASAAPQRFAAIVLGARVYADGTLSPVLEDRVQCAVELYRAGKVQRVLVSGDHGAHAYDEVNAMGRALMARGVPSEHVFQDHAGFRTLDTMDRAHAVFGVTQAAICTQRFHLPRALYLARSFGIDGVGVVADRRAYGDGIRNDVREILATASAYLDVKVGRRARLLGGNHPISGDGRTTRDRLSAK